MRKNYFSLLILLVHCLHNIVAQDCLPNGIILGNQAAIDSFTINYPGCKHVLGNLQIGTNSSTALITNLDSLYQVERVKYLYVMNNKALSSLRGLNRLKQIDLTFHCVGNIALENMSGLDSLSSIGGPFEFGYNNKIVNLKGLERLTNIGGGITFSNCAALTNLHGLDSLGSIGNFLYFVQNPVLSSLRGLEKIKTIPFYLSIFLNPALPNLDGLNNVTHIGNLVSITDNKSLTSLSGLENLQTVNSHLWIVNNYELSDISSLSNLTTVNGEFAILRAYNLTSIDGIKNINPDSLDRLEISGCPTLSNCAVESVCNYLGIAANPATIHSNGQGCDSRVEVEAACTTLSAEEKPNILPLKVYPNPAGKTINISGFPAGTAKVSNNLGIVVLKRAYDNAVMDVSGLPSGMYFLQVYSGKEMAVGCFLKE